MKLFSKSGVHFVEKERRSPVLMKWMTQHTCITCGDIVKASMVVLFGVAVGGVLLWQAARAAAPVEEETQTAVVEQLHAHPTVQPVQLVTVNEALALAVGIDAVISSVPGGENASDVTMLMVANVILNRVEDKRYPDTIDQVLCQPQQFSCFADTGIKWVGRAVTDEAWKKRCCTAAERALNGERMLSYNVVYVSSTAQGTVEAQLDGLYFCR